MTRKLVLVLLCLLQEARSEGFFTVVSSNLLHLPLKFPVLVTAQNYNFTKELQISIKGTTTTGAEYDDSKRITLKNDRTQRLVFDVS